MAWKIKNLKLAFVALLLFCLFISLGMWQLRRADEKSALLLSFSQRVHHTPLLVDNLNTQDDLRFYRAQLTGTFDNEHTFLLDNKTHNGKIGYEVYTPFRAAGLSTPILVDRGFIQGTGDRHTLPDVKAINDETIVVGMLNKPPLYAALGDMVDNNTTSWPLRVEFIELEKIGNLLNNSLFPYILTITPKHPAAFDLQWEIVMMSPERHQGYALQWFAFALTLLILFVSLNFKNKNK
jgi:surfeit locus 1 family protein